MKSQSSVTRVTRTQHAAVRSGYVRRLVALLAVLPLLAAACGGSHASAKPGFAECADAWNASSNAHDRATVAELVRKGYTHAGIQVSLTPGTRLQTTDPNPIGCRVVVFNDKRWVAYLAKRDDDRFVFRTGRPQFLADQSGGWPLASTRGPDNATVSVNGNVAIALDTRGLPLESNAWRFVLEDFVDDGRVNRPHSCAAVRAALKHLPTMSYVDRTLGGAEECYC